MPQSFFDSFDGTQIHCWTALPASVPPSAKIVLVHGFGTHSDSLHFRYLRDHLTGEGFAVYGFDLRGFGRSGGRRAYINRWEDFREDLRLFVNAVERDGATVPLFVLGVSLGGLIAVNYALHNPDGIRGVIAMSPALDASGVPVWRRILLRGLANIMPKLALKPGLDLTRLTRDQEAQRAFLRDPLLQTKMTLRLASETIAAMAETTKMLPHLKPALLVLHGSADVIIPPVAGKRMHDLAGCADREFRAFEGAFHILSMETNREEVFDCINSWIARRLTSTPPVGSFRDGPER
jgi:alpha-beta hydrolase superfamily lysophospholipase